MAETEGALAVFERHIGIHVGVVHHEQWNVGCEGTGILVDCHMLVFHLVDQETSLEHFFLVPAHPTLGIHVFTLGVFIVAIHHHNAGAHHIIGFGADGHLPLLDRGVGGICLILDFDRIDQVVDLPVVVLVPDVVDGGETEILIGTTITCHIVIANAAQQHFIDNVHVGEAQCRRSAIGRTSGGRIGVEIIAHVLVGWICITSSIHTFKASQ